MKIFHAVPKSHAGADEKHDIKFHWPDSRLLRLALVRNIFCPSIDPQFCLLVQTWFLLSNEDANVDENVAKQ